MTEGEGRMNTWNVWPELLHYKVAKRVTSDFLGSGYVFARRHKQILRFLTKRRAQQYADALNAIAAPSAAGREKEG